MSGWIQRFRIKNDSVTLADMQYKHYSDLHRLSCAKDIIIYPVISEVWLLTRYKMRWQMP